jgi:DNA helicase HerA-like ATPase
LKPFIGCIFGATGTGKSFAARAMVKSLWLSEKISILIYDPLPDGEWWKEFEEQGFLIARSLRGLVEIINDCYKIRKSHLYIVYWPDGSSGLDAQAEFEIIAGIVREWHNALFVIEEAALFCTAARIGDNAKSLIQWGRHNGISQLVITQRPSNLNINYRGNATWFRCFRLSDPNDLDWMRYAGLDPKEIESLRPTVENRWPSVLKDFSAPLEIPAPVKKRKANP